MKKLITSMMAVLSVSSIYAQDPANWKKDQEVTADLQWQNPKYEGDKTGWISNNAGIGWFYETDKCPTGSIEMYNNSLNAETYQLFWLPAGYYRFTVQAFYRPGSAWAAGWDTNEGRNGQFFVDAVSTETVTDEETGEESVNITAVNRQTSMTLMGICDDAYQGENKILTDDMCGDWQRDNGFTKDGLQYWVPNSMWGTSLYFDMGRYENELYVVNPTDGYVKLGIRKAPETISDDWIIFNNFRAYYVSDAGEAVQLMLAQEDLAKAEKAATTKSDEISELYGSLGALMSDAIMEAEIDNTTVKGCEDGTALYNNIIKDYEGYLAKAKELTSQLDKTAAIAAKNDDAALNTAIEAARAIEQDGTGDKEMTIDSPEAYQNALTALLEARSEFIKNFKSETGYIDVTAFVSYPWFCLPQYEPTWDAENNTWVPNEEALNTDSGDGKAWSEKDDCNGTISNIAKGVNVYGKESEVGVWYQHGGGGNLEVYWNDNLTCIKKWSLVAENYHDVSQRVSGIPNGFYKLKALAQTWSNDWNNNCENHIYIQSSSMESHSPYLELGGWWGKDINQWKELETDMVEVTDGEVIISSRDNGFAAFTGFRLLYFGETPDFNALISPAISAAQDKIDALAWEGDKAAAQALLNNVPTSIGSKDEYASALETINSVEKYVSDANNAINNFTNNTLAGFGALADQYASSNPESDIAMAGQIGALEVGENPTDTYLAAADAAKDLTAYQNYLAYFQNAKQYSDNAELKAALDAQAADLSANYANAAKLAEYQAVLAAPYNKALLASMGAGDASESKPLDITTLIVNPGYEEGSKGWSGAMTVAETKQETYQTRTYLVERWNTNFDISQTIYSLPAGTYKVQVQAFYRDGGGANDSYQNFWYNINEETGELKWEENQNAILFANDVTTPIVSIASESFAEDTFKQYVDNWKEAEEADAEGNIIYEADWKYQADQEAGKENDYPWDTKVEDIDEIFYYPNSVNGASNCFAVHPEAYSNSILVTIPEGGSITFGIRKEALIGNDWCVMDNWKLFYLGYDASTAIQNVADSSAASEIYSATGVRQNSLNKGVNVVKMTNGTVRKVLVK